MTSKLSYHRLGVVLLGLVAGAVKALGCGGVPEGSIYPFALYMRACDGGDMAGCFSAGVCHRTGACAEKNEAVANTLIQRACDGGDTRACANVSGR
jgi:TPR repeat protein